MLPACLTTRLPHWLHRALSTDKRAGQNIARSSSRTLLQHAPQAPRSDSYQKFIKLASKWEETYSQLDHKNETRKEMKRAKGRRKWMHLQVRERGMKWERGQSWKISRPTGTKQPPFLPTLPFSLSLSQAVINPQWCSIIMNAKGNEKWIITWRNFLWIHAIL